MVDTSWQQRLEIALEKSGLSLRAASLKAGRGSSYLHGMLSRKDREPSLAALADVAEALGVSATWLAFGVDLSASSEELLKQFSQLSEEQQQAVLLLTKSLSEK